jgi:hypothetical protein
MSTDHPSRMDSHRSSGAFIPLWERRISGAPVQSTSILPAYDQQFRRRWRPSVLPAPRPGDKNVVLSLTDGDSSTYDNQASWPPLKNHSPSASALRLGPDSSYSQKVYKFNSWRRQRVPEGQRTPILRTETTNLQSTAGLTCRRASPEVLTSSL